MEQRSDIWLKWREAGLGSSDVAAILGVSPWKTAYKLWAEKTGLEADNTVINPAMQKGIDFEPRARVLWELLTGCEAEPMIMEYDDWPVARCSLDGFCKDKNIIIEIKYSGREDYENAKIGIVPIKYYPQIQHQLLVSNALYCDFVSYSEDEDNIAVVHVYPDHVYLSELLEKEMDFWGLVQSKTPPPLEDRDYKPVDDDAQKIFIDEWRAAKLQIDELEKKLETLKAEIVAKSTHPRMRHGDVRINFITAKGNIEYKLIPELSGVDLEKYRKKDKQYYQLSITKKKETVK